MFTWSVSKGVQGPRGQVYTDGAGVNTRTGSMCILGWLGMLTGIATHASEGETAHAEEAW